MKTFKRTLKNEEKRIFDVFQSDCLSKNDNFNTFFLKMSHFQEMLNLLFKNTQICENYEDLNPSLLESLDIFLENLPNSNILNLFNEDLVNYLRPDFERYWFKIL